MYKHILNVKFKCKMQVISSYGEHSAQCVIFPS